MRTRKAQIIDWLKAELKALGGGKYRVRRGMVNWPTWDFTAHPKGCSLSIPEDDEEDGIVCRLVVNVVMMVQAGPAYDGFDIDETLFEEMKDDVRTICDRLRQVVDENGPDPLVLDVNRTPFLELADSASGLQGVSSTFTVEY